MGACSVEVPTADHRAMISGGLHTRWRSVEHKVPPQLTIRVELSRNAELRQLDNSAGVEQLMLHDSTGSLRFHRASSFVVVIAHVGEPFSQFSQSVLI
jgi:hypothetical protein